MSRNLPDSTSYVSALEAIYESVFVEGLSSYEPVSGTVVKARLERHQHLVNRIKGELIGLRACRQILAAALHLIGVAIFIVDEEKRVVFLNEAAIVFRDKNLSLAVQNSALVALDHPTDLALQAALSDALKESANPKATHVLLQGGRRSLAAVVLPTPRVPNGAVNAVVFISDPDSQVETGIDGLARTYALTAGEIRLVTALATGDGLVAAARALNITQATARTHLKHIFAKTQTERQSELMRLLATVAPPTRQPKRV